MARGVNKVILVGNLGRDPETRYMTSGDAVVNVSIATSKQWRDRETGEDRSKTEWHRLVFFRRLAEIAGEYLKKGSQVYVEGELQTREWEKEGQKHYTTEVVVNEMQMLGGRGDVPPGDSGGGSSQGGSSQGGSSQGGSSQGGSSQGGSSQGGASQGGASGGGSSQKGGASGDDFGAPPADSFDDDIPF